MDLVVSMDSSTDDFSLTHTTTFRGIVGVDYTVATNAKGYHSGLGGGVIP